MNTNKSSRVVIVISVEDVYYSVKCLFKSELPATWFDNNEVDEIITRIFNITISNILNNVGNKSPNVYNECYQGNIDYLEYCGISQTTAFKIVHVSEMGILKSIFDACPILDDSELINIIEYKFLYMSDLHIIVEFKNLKNYEQNINYTNRQHSTFV